MEKDTLFKVLALNDACALAVPIGPVFGLDITLGCSILGLRTFMTLEASNVRK
jgi:hypothetical protein